MKKLCFEVLILGIDSDFDTAEEVSFFVKANDLGEAYDLADYHKTYLHGGVSWEIAQVSLDWESVQDDFDFLASYALRHGILTQEEVDECDGNPSVLGSIVWDKHHATFEMLDSNECFEFIRI